MYTAALASRWGRITVVISLSALIGTFCGGVWLSDLYHTTPLAVGLIFATFSRLSFLAVWVQGIYPDHPGLGWCLVAGTSVVAFLLRILPAA